MSNKVLFFEGAGCVPRGDVENCRIRTAFINDEGKRFYLELTGVEATKHSPKHLREQYLNIGYVDYCYELGEHGGEFSYKLDKTNFEYCKQSILDFVNVHLKCSFESIIITDMFDGYRVHGHRGSVNLMDDFVYRPEMAARAREAFHRVDMEVREKLGEKYSQITLHNLGDYAISVRCYASEVKMKSAGMDPEKRIMTILI